MALHHLLKKKTSNNNNRNTQTPGRPLEAAHRCEAATNHPCGGEAGRLNGSAALGGWRETQSGVVKTVPPLLRVFP